MTGFGFDVGATEASVPMDPIPAGWYACTVVRAEAKHSDTAGEMLNVAFEVDPESHPDYAKRYVWSLFCHHHPTSDKARNIARSNIAAICRAVGKPNASGYDELLGTQLLVKVKIQPARDGYEARNETCGYKPLGDDVPEQPQASSQGGGNRKPWAR